MRSARGTQASLSLVVLAIMYATPAVTLAARPRHVVVLLVDDLGYGDTGHRGAEYPTKAIDELATGGIILNQSYVLQLCSPSRAALISSRYSYNIGMDGAVLNNGDARCVNTTTATLGDRLSKGGVRTAFIGKYDLGYSSWGCTPNCRGFDYWLGYYGAAQDYYLHGGPKALDFHENYNQAPQYRGEYSTELFVRKGIEWVQNETSSKNESTLLYLAFQAVHSPIEMPPHQYHAACGHIKEPTRCTYCAMMQSLDEGIANLTAAYKQLNIFDDTLFLFLADNGGQNTEGGFNVPLRGQKATLWEGGVRSQTFVHWSGFAPQLKGSVYAGMVHATDWGPTLQSALLNEEAKPNPGEQPLDGINVWPAITSGGESPRKEMLLSMRDAGECAGRYKGCQYAGQLAYRRGPYKLLYGHTALKGVAGDGCAWSAGKSGKAELNCWNGWGQPRDAGASRAPIVLPSRPGQPANSSLYSWGGVFLFDIVNDELEEHDLSASKPEVVQELITALKAYIQQDISQDVMKDSSAKMEQCGGAQGKLLCSVPWLPYDKSDRCKPGPPAPPTPPAPPVPGQNCCQCLKLGGDNACAKMCHKHPKLPKCTRCVVKCKKGGGASCESSCGCK